jgi:hypothetical protein
MSAEVHCFLEDINPGQRPKNVDNSPAIDHCASMGMSQVVDSIEEEVGKSMILEEKKKIFRLSQEKVEYYLSFRPKPVSRRLIEHDPLAAAEREKLREQILAEQEKIRREYEAKGYVTYIAEVPDDGVRYEGEVADVDEEEKDAAAVVKQAEVIVGEKKGEDAALVKQAEFTVDEKRKEDASVLKQTEINADEKKEDDAAAEAEFPGGADPLI